MSAFEPKLQGILINGQFPGPQIESVTNDNLIINVFNSLDEPFLISWLAPLHLFLLFNANFSFLSIYANENFPSHYRRDGIDIVAF